MRKSNYKRFNEKGIDTFYRYLREGWDIDLLPKRRILCSNQMTGAEDSYILTPITGKNVPDGAFFVKEDRSERAFCIITAEDIAYWGIDYPQSVYTDKGQLRRFCNGETREVAVRKAALIVVQKLS